MTGGTCRCEHEDHFGDAPKPHAYADVVDELPYVAAPVGSICRPCGEGHLVAYATSAEILAPAAPADGDDASMPLQRELLDTRRRLDEAIRSLRVLGDAVRAVAGSTDTTRGIQSVCSLAALHVDQVLMEIDR